MGTQEQTGTISDLAKKFEVVRQVPADEQSTGVPTCNICSESEWWIDVYDSEPRCLICSPPPVRSLVKREFWYDLDGNLWEIDGDLNTLIGKIQPDQI